MRLLLGAVAIVMALIFVKWRNWREYYPTILFMISLNLTLSSITDNHRLWVFQESAYLTSHTLSDLFHTFVTFPCTVLLFLSHYPNKKRAQVYFTVAWAFLYSWAEFLFSTLGLMTYDNNWSIYWSAVFNVVMFPILRVHYSKPLLAWGLSALVMAFIWLHFGFSPDMLR